MLLGSGFLVTAPTLTRLLSLLMCPMLSTRFIEQLSCGAVRVHFPSLSPWVDCCYRHESTLFTGSGNVALQSIHSARGVQQETPSVRFSSLFSSTTASVLVLPQPSDVSSPLSLKASAALGSLSIWTIRRSSRRARSPMLTSRGAHGMALPISNFWVLQLGLMHGVRNFSGWSKVLYSCRTVPPSAQMCGLRTADNDLRAALSQLIGRPLTEDDWRLASLGGAAGGLGARCAAEHGPAAYVASFFACRELCGRLWPAFDPFDLDEGCRLAAAEEALRGAISSGASIYAVSDSPSQRSLVWDGRGSVCFCYLWGLHPSSSSPLAP